MPCGPKLASSSGRDKPQVDKDEINTQLLYTNRINRNILESRPKHALSLVNHDIDPLRKRTFIDISVHKSNSTTRSLHAQLNE